MKPGFILLLSILVSVGAFGQSSITCQGGINVRQSPTVVVTINPFDEDYSVVLFKAPKAQGLQWTYTHLKGIPNSSRRLLQLFGESGNSGSLLFSEEMSRAELASLSYNPDPTLQNLHLVCGPSATK